MKVNIYSMLFLFSLFLCLLYCFLLLLLLLLPHPSQFCIQLYFLYLSVIYSIVVGNYDFDVIGSNFICARPIFKQTNNQKKTTSFLLKIITIDGMLLISKSNIIKWFRRKKKLPTLHKH